MAHQLADELLKLEDKSDVLNFRFSCDDLLLWPFARYGVFLHAIESRLGIPWSAGAPAPLNWRKRAESLWRSLLDSPFRGLRPFPIVIFGGTTGVVIRKGDKWFGRVNDYFALEFEDQSLVVDFPANGEYRHPRYIENVRCHDLIRIQAGLWNKVLGRPSKKDCETVRDFVGFLRTHLPVPPEESFCQALERKLVSLSSKLRHLRPLYMRFFESAKPKIVFLEDGSYGETSYIYKWARDSGALTGEFQHGTVYPSHMAYNYGRAVFESVEYQKYLPDHLLTYGTYWNEVTRTPSRKVTIGSPHFSERRRAFVNKAREGAGPKILLLSDGCLPEEFVEWARLLSEAGKRGAWRISLKPHPTEGRSAGRRYADLLRLGGNVSILPDGDVFDVLADCDAVVGTNSTALFEAVGFGKPVFVYDYAGSQWGIPPDMGTRFRNAEELVERLQTYFSSRESVDQKRVESFWADGWKQNYRCFVNEIVLKESQCIPLKISR
ncbi:MAG: hypothetical protein HY548_00685 [Elusimicrobia bacterium]|nr:hypothetical protein [Elusimicrobiota bacterium]